MATKLFYGTFGCGHPIYPGKVQVILADDMAEAREIMFAVHDKYFCTVYTEEEWKAWIERAKSNGLNYETPLEFIISKEDIEDIEHHTNYAGTEYELKRDYGG